MLQSLDVGLYGPLKKQIRKILDNSMKESRTRGAIPKPQFSMLLKGLMGALVSIIKNNKQSFFESTGLRSFRFLSRFGKTQRTPNVS